MVAATAAAAASTSRSLLSSGALPLRSSLRCMVRPIVRPATATGAILPSRRQLHSLPALPESLAKGQGCEPLFSAQTLRLLWDDWHGGLLNKLNDEVRGTRWENAGIAETVIGTSQDAEMIQAFNYASLALNNGFFLAGLKPKQLPAGMANWSDVPPPKPSEGLASELERHFDSVPSFKLAFSSAAYGMSGSGYVWLVRDRNDNLGIVPTFGAGTVLVQNRQQREGARPEWTQVSQVEGRSSASGRRISGTSDASNQQPSFTPLSGATGSTPPHSRMFSSGARLGMIGSERSESHGEELFPLLCVSVHERDWLPDYGMWGKEEYLMRFWECVDWTRVSRLYEAYRAT